MLLSFPQCFGQNPGSGLPNTGPPGVAAGKSKAVKPATSEPAKAAPEAVAMYECEVVHTYPHDRAAFTQGLVFHDGYLLESTGLKGRSSIRKVELVSGRVLQQLRLSEEYFAEGLAVFDTNIFQ